MKVLCFEDKKGKYRHGGLYSVNYGNFIFIFYYFYCSFICMLLMGSGCFEYNSFIYKQNGS